MSHFNGGYASDSTTAGCRCVGHAPPELPRAFAFYVGRFVESPDGAGSQPLFGLALISTLWLAAVRVFIRTSVTSTLGAVVPRCVIRIASARDAGSKAETRGAPR